MAKLQCPLLLRGAAYASMDTSGGVIGQATMPLLLRGAGYVINTRGESRQHWTLNNIIDADCCDQTEMGICHLSFVICHLSFVRISLNQEPCVLAFHLTLLGKKGD